MKGTGMTVHKTSVTARWFEGPPTDLAAAVRHNPGVERRILSLSTETAIASGDLLFWQLRTTLRAIFTYMLV